MEVFGHIFFVLFKCNRVSNQIFLGFAGLLAVGQLAIRHNKIDVAKHLLQRNIDVNETGNGLSPLHIAAHTSSLDAAKLLLQHPNVNVNCKSGNGSTPLHEAAKKNNIKLAKLLIEKKAEIELFGLRN